MIRTFTTYRRTRLDCRGSILLMVLVAIIIMTLTTSTYLLLMRNEHLAARYSGNHLQAEMLAESGIDYLRANLSLSAAEIEQLGGLIDNADLLQDVLVIDDPLESYRGRFTVVAPAMSDGYYANLRYGLEDESAKLNLNSLVSNPPAQAAGQQAQTLGQQTAQSPNQQAFEPKDRLMMIPGMNEEVADAILDWLDADDSERTYGVESAHYASQTPSYQARNGPIAHLDELLMVQGVTPELLYGVDVNRNYSVEADELPRGELQQLDNSTGTLNRGWSAYLTVHSLETNKSLAGEDKIDVNSPLLQTLHGELQQALGAAEANFIIAYRQHGPANANGSAMPAAALPPDFSAQAQHNIGSLLDLIGATVSVPGTDGAAAQLIESPWSDTPNTYRQTFPDLLDQVTNAQGDAIAGRININQASRPVLMTIPGMTDALADQILARRNPTVNRVTGEQRHPTWLVADGLITLAELKPMFPWLTTGGDVFSCQVVGFFDAGTARSRVEVILGRIGSTAPLLSWHDLSHLGPGFSRTTLSNLVNPER